MANKRIYRAKAMSWGLGISGEGTPKEKEQLAVEFQVLTEGAPESALTWYGYFTEATADRTIEAMRYMGWTGTDFAALEGLDANEVELVVEDEEYEGNVRAKVQWVNKPGGLGIKAPLVGDRLKTFAAQMKGRVAQFDAAGGRPAPAPAKPAAAKPAPAARKMPPIKDGDSRPEPPPLADADIPF